MSGLVVHNVTMFTWVKVFRIIPEFSILRLIFHSFFSQKVCLKILNSADLGDNFIWVGISLDIRSEITFYGDARA